MRATLLVVALLGISVAVSAASSGTTAVLEKDVSNSLTDAFWP